MSDLLLALLNDIVIYSEGFDQANQYLSIAFSFNKKLS